jgi:hypothetical protein
MNDHFLKMHFNGWSNDALNDRRLEIIRFNESKLELKMIELERRKEAEEVA